MMGDMSRRATTGMASAHHVGEDLERRVRGISVFAGVKAGLADLELFEGQHGRRNAQEQQQHVQMVDIKLLDERVTSAQLRDDEHHGEPDGERIREELVVRARELDVQCCTA